MVKDGIVEETVEEMTLTITPDSDDDSEDEDLIDEDDRQIIDRALEQLTETDPQNTSTCTNPGVCAAVSYWSYRLPQWTFFLGPFLRIMYNYYIHMYGLCI